MAIVLDDEIISSPQVNVDVPCGVGIAGGATSITGDFTQQEAEELSLLVRAGALPVPVDLVERRVIGPTLGAAAIEASLLASVLGIVATLLLMLAAYRLFGLIASIGLAIYGVIAYAALVGIGATLTLPGLAGFVLAIGMAVDANVLVFERAKEEHRAGHTVRTATARGFQNAFTAIIDSNVTTVIAAALLIMLASGAVRGFGVTVTMGVVVSMFTALVVVRVMAEWVIRWPALGRRPDTIGLTAWQGIRTRLEESNPDLIGRSRWWITGSAAALLIAAGGVATQGLSWGLEFTGGRLLEYRTEQEVDVDALRSDLAGIGLPTATVQTTADDQVAVRIRQLEGTEEQELVDTIADHGGELDVVRDEFIGPTIGAELRRNALIALGIALAGQLIYLAVRFRWTYGSAAVAGMAHNVAILVGVFAWLGKTFDGVFLAALLAVIGYSINDTVVIFDRIREMRKLEPKTALATVTNRALIQTLPRTFNTGIGTLFILIALFLLGGDTLSDFALALILGTTVGMYSSLLFSSPLFVGLESRWPQSTHPRRPPPSSRPGRRSKAVV